MDRTDAEYTPSLGTCCICGGANAVRNIFMLNAKAPVRGHGWGCMQCGLPSHGASAVICDTCAVMHAHHVEDALGWVCRGYPGSDGRMRVEELRGEHGHDQSKHPELEQHPPLQPHGGDRRYEDHAEEGQGCHCSRCGQTIWEGTIAVRMWPASGDWQYRYHPSCLGATPMDEDPYTDDDWA